MGTSVIAPELFFARAGLSLTAAEILAANRAAGEAAEVLAKTELIAEGNIILGSQVGLKAVRRILHRVGRITMRQTLLFYLFNIKMRCSA